MKGALSAILIALVIVLVALFFIKRGGPSTPPTPTKLAIVAELPAETSLLCMAPSLEKLYELLKLEDNTLLGYDISEVIDEMNDDLGVNLLSISDLQKLGVDGNKEIGFYVTDLSEVTASSPKGAGTIFIPLTKDATLKSFLIEKIKENNDVTVSEEKGYTLVKEEDEQFTMALAQKGNYLFMAVGVDNQRVSKEITLLLTGTEKLTDSENYKNSLKGLEGGGTAFAYVDMSLLSESYMSLFDAYNKSMNAFSKFTMNSERLIEMMKASQGFSCWLDINEEDLIVRSVGTMSKEHFLTNCFKTNTLKSPVYNVTKRPVLLSSQSLDFSTYIKEYIKVYNISDSDLEEFFTLAQTTAGIDIKENLYENLGEHIGFGIYDAETINMGTYNILAAIELKDKARGEKLLADITKKVKAELKNAGTMVELATTIETVTIEGVRATKIAFPMTFRLFYGMHNNTLLIASERALFKEAVSGSQKSGFVKNLNDTELKNIFTPAANSIGFLDIDGLATAVENFKSTIALTMAAMDPSVSQKVNKMITAIATEVRKMNYISGVTAVEDGRINSEFRISTDYGVPFVEGTNNIVNNIKKIIEENN